MKKRGSSIPAGGCHFYLKHGLTATKEAYKVGRSSIFFWKKNYQKSRGNLLSLIPHSTKPKTTRRIIVDPKILEFIKNLRENNTRLGKEKVKILVDAYCQRENLPFISASKIGRIIKRNNWFYYKAGRIYHNPPCPCQNQSPQGKTFRAV